MRQQEERDQAVCHATTASPGQRSPLHLCLAKQPVCVPSPTLSPADPVPRGLLTLCPAPTDPVGHSHACLCGRIYIIHNVSVSLFLAPSLSRSLALSLARARSLSLDRIRAGRVKQSMALFMARTDAVARSVPIYSRVRVVFPCFQHLSMCVCARACACACVCINQFKCQCVYI